MSRFRLYPTVEQEKALLSHCGHARYVWNLALEQRSWYGRAGRGQAPGYANQNQQLTAARTTSEWLAAGSVIVQQQALRDADQAWRHFFNGTHRRPTWRKADRNEGFRIVGCAAQRVRKLNRRWSAVNVPKIGWVKFRRTRAVSEAKSYRVTRDAAGRWHIAFASIPESIPAPGNGEIVGVDLGVAVSAALSTGELLNCPAPNWEQIRRLQRRMSRARRGSTRRGQMKTAVARVSVRAADRRKDWVEKTSTDLARRFDLIRIENLSVKGMTRSARGTVAEPGRNVRQKAALNRGILTAGWGQLVQRLQDKAPGRVEKVKAAFTSQRCSRCGHTAPESRENQSRFRCVACAVVLNADVNAAQNIAAGHAVTARGGTGLPEPVNREPQLPLAG